jgi:hypothetical protein
LVDAWTPLTVLPIQYGCRFNQDLSIGARIVGFTSPIRRSARHAAVQLAQITQDLVNRERTQFSCYLLFEVVRQFAKLFRHVFAFVGRTYVFQAIDDFCHCPNIPCGYFFITGDPGAGKSAILAEYVKRTNCICHFNIQSQGVTRYEQFFESIHSQFQERYSINDARHEPSPFNDPLATTQLLKQIVALRTADPLIIAVDALDEVDVSPQAAGSNPLYLPSWLPQRTYFLVSTRRVDDAPVLMQTPSQTLDLRDYQSHTAADIAEYVHACTRRPSLRDLIRSNDVPVDRFVAELTKRCDNNFMYARYMVQAVECGEYDSADLDRLPSGLEGYYRDHWRRMGMTSAPLPTPKIKILYVLCEVDEPISARTISQFSQIELLTVQQVLREWSQFLHQSTFPEDKRYSIYHNSFRDFLRRSDIVQSAGVTLENIHASIANDLWHDLRPDE